jgi:predicted RNA binding protein YcfA (HicA-like mRNA interferase family)
MAKRNRYSASDKINEIVRALIKAGWELIRHKRHPRLRSPDGKTHLTVPFTPSDHRAELNWISQIRLQGVTVPA